MNSTSPHVEDRADHILLAARVARFTYVAICQPREMKNRRRRQTTGNLPVRVPLRRSPSSPAARRLVSYIVDVPASLEGDLIMSNFVAHEVSCFSHEPTMP